MATDYVEGDQIKFVCDGKVQYGFVHSVTERHVFCKFFYPDGPLRNKCSSDGCNRSELVKEVSRNQKIIDDLLRKEKNG